MKVKIKRLTSNAVIPSYQKKGDAGMDLVATSKIFDKNGNVSYGTGISMEIPEGYVGLVFPRSSISKQDLTLANSVGVIDSGYRGEIMLKFKPAGYFASVPQDDKVGFDSDSYDYICFGKESVDEDTNVALYEIGDRIGQIIIIPIPHIEFEEVLELSMSERGEGGFGSTNTAM